MAIEKLTDTRIKKLKAKDKEYAINDGNGLYLVITSSNAKKWVFRYTSPINQKRRKGGLGNYPNVPLTQARNKAKEYHALIAEGIDPIDKKEMIGKKIKGACM